MTLLDGPLRAVSLSEPDLGLARTSSETLSHFLPDDLEPITLRIENPKNGQQIEAVVPAAAVQVLAEALARMAEGQPVTLVPLQAELSTQQAAELMGVSRPYFVKLLEQGRIPFRKVGEQRRVRYRDLLRYLEEYQQHALAAVTELSAEAQELGIYE